MSSSRATFKSVLTMFPVQTFQIMHEKSREGNRFFLGRDSTNLDPAIIIRVGA